MPIEAANFIKDLVVANPSGSDQIAELDNHIRLIKQVLKNSFPNLDAAVSGNASSLNATVPIGGILAYTGSVSVIPAGFVLCAGQTGLTRSDGQGSINAPDLRHRFIMGTGEVAAGYVGINSVGGAPSHTHGISVGGTSLTVDQLPAHTHGVNDPGHAHGVNDPGHAHTTTVPQGAGVGVAPGAYGILQAGAQASTTDRATSNISLALNGSNISIYNTGSGAAHGHAAGADVQFHLPPYVALAYIMKI